MNHYLSVLLVACFASVSWSPSAMADTEFSVGASFVQSNFNENNWGLVGLFNDVELDDDTDSGYELFVRAEFSPLWTFKLGYADQGRFTFVGGGLFGDEADYRGSADVQYTFLAWSPRWHINDQFSLSPSVGISYQNIDVHNHVGDASISDGNSVRYALEAEYRFVRSFGVRAEAGYMFASELESGWVSIGGTYYF